MVWNSPGIYVFMHLGIYVFMYSPDIYGNGKQ